MKRLFVFLIFIISLFFMIPYMLTASLRKIREGKSVNLSKYDSGYSVKINEKSIDLEQYIAGILPTTISLEKEEEALKAQAVILRTQIKKKMGDKKVIDASKLPYQYESNEQLKQKIGNRNYIEKNTKREKAVVETIGKCITYEGSLICAYYHELSVGTTLNGAQWLGKEIPYLQEKSAYEDTEDDDYVDTREYTYGEIVDQLKEKLQINITTENAKKTLAISDATKNGYVRKVKIGKRYISGTKFAKSFQLPSANYYFEHYDGKFRILTLGKGSGLGMSQNKADVMAKKGKKYKTILKYFFPKTKIQTISE